MYKMSYVNRANFAKVAVDLAKKQIRPRLFIIVVLS